MSGRIDLNADLGEGAAGEGDVLRCVSSASIACGLHAGDPVSLMNSLRAAADAGVAVGAHPSLDDRANFGRTEMVLAAENVAPLLGYQLGGLAALAKEAGVRLRHVKLHGALYNMAARDRALAVAVVKAVAEFDRELIVYTLPGCELARAAEAAGLKVAREFFADRNYRQDGSLVPRGEARALVHDAGEAADRVLRVLRNGVVPMVDGGEFSLKAETVCLHGDSPEAVTFARTLRARLAAAGVKLSPPFS